MSVAELCETCQSVTATKDIRRALMEAAARLLAEQGPQALTTRRLAAEVGTSTMAVYTHFGGMEELRRAIREDGFARLEREWAGVEQMNDPVADLSVSGATYVAFALANPNLYRAMLLESRIDNADLAASSIGGPQLAILTRCMDAGRFDRTDPAALLWQLWAATHGVVSGVLAGVLDIAMGIEQLAALGLSLYVGFGDERPAARASLERARARIAQ